MYSSLIWRGASAWFLLNLVGRVNPVTLISTHGAYVFYHPPGLRAHPVVWEKAIRVFHQKRCEKAPAVYPAIGCDSLGPYTCLQPNCRWNASIAGSLSNAAGSPDPQRNRRALLFCLSWILPW